MERQNFETASTSDSSTSLLPSLTSTSPPLSTSTLSPTSNPSSKMPHYTTRDLQTAPGNLWYRIHVFTYDLRNYRKKVDAEPRLEHIVDASYLGSPYFDPQEVEMLKATDINGGKTLAQLIEETLNERLSRRIKKRADSGDYRVCAAHDLAPIFEKAFNINPKELSRDEGFLAFVSGSGLQLEDSETWTGLGRKRNQFKPKNQKRRKCKH